MGLMVRFFFFETPELDCELERELSFNVLLNCSRICNW